MIRSQSDSKWILVNHRDHAHLAGEFAKAWGNGRFAVPEPFDHVLYAVAHHDDGWIARDAVATLTKDKKPEAFSSALVGAYSAFEEIDLPSYLRVRGEATAAVAANDLYAGVLVSMHTVNLLTEQADPSTIRPEHRAVYDTFIAGQKNWQKETAASLGADPAALERGFEFLQCCDNLSLITCSGYDAVRDLRHKHPDRSGSRHALKCRPVDGSTWQISPWPFREQKIDFAVPFREVPLRDCADFASYQKTFLAAPTKRKTITLVAGN